jgi:hypothetical protein
MSIIRERRGVVRSLVAAMATKPFLILAGLSGSGKTQLARRLAAGIAAGPLGEEGYSRTLLGHEGRLHEALMRAIVGSGVAPDAYDDQGGEEDYIDVLPLVMPPNARPKVLSRDEYGRMMPDLATRSYHDVLDNRIAFMPVRPEWRDARQLWGSYNPLTGLFYPTRALRVVVHAMLEYLHLGDKAGRHFLILDEMNISRVEYYMSDLLSLMEAGASEAPNDQRRLGEMIEVHPFAGPIWALSAPRLPGESPSSSEQLYRGKVDRGWAQVMGMLTAGAGNAVIDAIEVDFEEVISGADWHRIIPPQICLTPNLTILGTVNIDETTHAFAPKVLDRAFVVEFEHLDFDAVCGDWPGYGEIQAEVKALQQILEPARMHFGYRVVREWLGYLEASGRGWAQEGDFLVSSKILPRLRGTAEELGGPLRALLAWCLGEDEAPVCEALCEGEQETFEGWLSGRGRSPEGARHVRSARRCYQMVRELDRVGVTSFL